MFSGIIQGVGLFQKGKSNNIFIKTQLDLSDCKIGSSISCDGVCLTMTSIKKENETYIFSVNVSEETQKKSNLSAQNVAHLINLEKSLKLGDEISGHFVYGHVDCYTKIKNITQFKSSWEFDFEKDQQNINMKRFIVEKGSISINGISLTVADVKPNSFTISIIPHTYKNTNLKQLNVNDSVNVEFDALARYATRDE